MDDLPYAQNEVCSLAQFSIEDMLQEIFRRDPGVLFCRLYVHQNTPRMATAYKGLPLLLDTMHRHIGSEIHILLAASGYKAMEGQALPALQGVFEKHLRENPM